MISVVKNLATVPVRLTAARCLEKKLQCITDPATHKHDTYYYRDGSYDDLVTIYQAKCAYCETGSNAGTTFRVDHFRPKNKVEGVTHHQGYYWLTYEWSNLVLACERCNGKKSNKFPISAGATRIVAPVLAADGHCTPDYRNIRSAVYVAESAVLLNPEVDKVEDHFVFLPTGEMKALSDRGTVTINMLKLNRHALTLARKKMVDKIVLEINACVDDYISSGNDSHITITLMRVFEKLSKLPDRKNRYSRFAWFMFTKFDVFFANRFGPKQAIVVKETFDAFRARAV